MFYFEREAGSGHIIDILRSTIERCPILLKYCPLLEKGLNRREGKISGGPFSKKVSRPISNASSLIF